MTAMQALILGAIFAFWSMGIEDGNGKYASLCTKVTALLGIGFLFVAGYKVLLNILGVMLR